MFKVGEVVSYGVTGICTIEDIRELSLSRTGANRQVYYVLRPAAAPTCVTYVPTANKVLTEKMLQSAERIVGEEFSYALGIEQNEVSAYIAEKLK